MVNKEEKGTVLPLKLPVGIENFEDILYGK